ncbi:hypothetical protein ACFL08_04335 [Patescibacteria group bacterium]
MYSKKIPAEMKQIVLILNNCKNQEECLKKAYDIITNRYRGYRWATLTHFDNLFITDPERLWNKKILICTNLNHLLKITLIHTKFFTEADIQTKWTLIWFISLHQYLRVRVNGSKFINVDPWGKAYGVKFGGYSNGFH